MRRPKFETATYQGVVYHVGCAGQVIDGVCVKCGAREPEGNIFSRTFDAPWLVEDIPDPTKEDKKRIERLGKMRVWRNRIRGGGDISF